MHAHTQTHTPNFLQNINKNTQLYNRIKNLNVPGTVYFEFGRIEKDALKPGNNIHSYNYQRISLVPPVS